MGKSASVTTDSTAKAKAKGEKRGANAPKNFLIIERDPVDGIKLRSYTGRPSLDAEIRRLFSAGCFQVKTLDRLTELSDPEDEPIRCFALWAGGEIKGVKEAKIQLVGLDD